MPRKIPPSDESDIDEKQNNFDESRSKRMPGKISGWKKVQEALANERIVSVHKEDLPSLKEKRVEELIERIENQSKMSEKVVPTISKPKSQHHPHQLILQDELYLMTGVNTLTGKQAVHFILIPEHWKKGGNLLVKVSASTLASETSQISSEKSPSLKSLKVPSPVLPPNSNLLWPHRERSFTSSSGHSNNTTILNSKLHSSISLNPDKASHTLPSNPTPSIGIPIPSKGSNTLPLNPISQNEPSPTPKSSRSFFSAISSSLSFIKHSGNNHSNQAATGYSDCPSPASSHSPPQAPPSSAKPLLGGGSNCSTPGTPSSLESLNEEPEHWNPAIDKCGTIYVYSATGGESKWTLQEEALREDILNWRVTMKDGKKAKKSWSTSYAKYYPNMKKNIYGKSFGSITFAKKLNETKKLECFDLVPPCFIDFNLKKPNCFCLRNGDLMEILVQADTPTVATEWTKLLIENIPSLEAQSVTSVRRKNLTPQYLCLQCIKNIEKNKENFKVDGLYRISGNASKIQKIRIEIAQNRYTILEEEKDVHNLTGALKLFFRELKEPLIPFANYVSFIQATESTSMNRRTG
ncbi:Rho GTPase-activating protein 27 [Armadillidium nasatum]|uniref:Rho GTPase-activating protein 27 n=1 Tax=Armadillidium nasatum TaxID=96803 RepID=A0A5N5SW48_9CRUS|nr:Rho GTPase-activating protein 27 [Armadillidium nasatum]